MWRQHVLLAQARVGRLHILDIMKEAFDMNAITLPPGVARMKRFDIPSKLVGRCVALEESGCLACWL